MLETIIDNIKQGQNVRENLIELKKWLKGSIEHQDTFLSFLQYDYTLLKELLCHEDPKVRKNVAGVIGELELEGLLPELFDAYEEEGTLFVKTAYLKAFQKIDCECYVPKFKERLEYLLSEKFTEEQEKHITEEIRELTSLIGQYERTQSHYFIGYDEQGKVVLTTNRYYPELTLRQLYHCNGKKISGGVAVEYEDMRDFMSIRTWQEILFPLPSAKNMPLDPKVMAHTILMGGLMEFLEARHLGGGSYRFRVELRGRISIEEKRVMAKKIAMAMEKESSHRLINSVSDYEVEIRLLEGRNGGYHAYLKLYTIPDNRFAYRKGILATSINPMTAATIMELARPYLKENAQVLDPFCGTGTMLIERNFALPAHPLYGVDLFGKAIDCGRENAKRARTQINFIHRDFKDFFHEYLFDEIVVNMPSTTGKQGEKEIEELYELLLQKGQRHLKKGGIAIIYSQDPSIALSVFKRHLEWKRMETFQIYQKDASYLYILKYIG
ncbi:MAG: methyltransferase [Clostridiales bacterium]|nr:methyltransferase [Clostridiales bacterium]